MIIILGLILAFLLVLILSNRRTRSCRWREDRRRDEGGTKYFKCAVCGAQAFTTTGKPPENCHATPPAK